jgi:hypothetical protein
MTPPTEEFTDFHGGWHQPDVGRKPNGDSMKSPQQKASAPDVLVHNEGTVFLFNPLTARAKEWIDDNVETEPHQWFGTTLVVEHRYAWGLAQGMKQNGLVLQ